MDRVLTMLARRLEFCAQSQCKKQARATVALTPIFGRQRPGIPVASQLTRLARIGKLQVQPQTQLQ